MTRTRDRKSISRVLAVVLVIAVILAAGVVAIYIPSVYLSAKTSSEATAKGSTSSSPVRSVGPTSIIIPNGTGENQSLNFSPSAVRVVVGINNTLVWTNNDHIPHTVVSTSVPAETKAFASDLISQGGTFSVTLTVPGTYKYYCSIHPTWMIASVTVVAG